jgi:hypothetical protein
MRGAFTTMLFGSRHHFDVAVRSEAYDQHPGIPNTKEKPDQGNGYRGFLIQWIPIHVVTTL